MFEKACSLVIPSNKNSFEKAVEGSAEWHTASPHESQARNSQIPFMAYAKDGVLGYFYQNYNSNKKRGKSSVF